MKKFLLFFFILSISSVSAQRRGYVSGDATVNLIVPLSVTAGSGDLDFGDILLTGSAFTETIKPKSGKQFIVVGQPGRNITIRFSNVELTNYQWASINNEQFGKLTFIPDVATKNSKTITDGTSLNLAKKGLVGELELYVGGSIDISSKQQIGNYEGLFVLSVTY